MAQKQIQIIPPFCEGNQFDSLTKKFYYNSYPNIEDFPQLIGRILEIELTSRCQLNCNICPRLDIKNTRGHGLMTKETIRAIVEKFLPNDIDSIHICGIGEPTLHPKWFEFCSLIKGRSNAKLILSSNGINFPDVAQLSISSIDRLEISYHLADNVVDHVSFESKHKSFTSKFKLFLHEFEKLDQKCEVSLGMVIHKESASKVKMVQQMAQTLGIEFVTWRAWNRAGAVNQELCKVSSDEVDFSINPSPHVCLEYGESIFIDWLGQILPCCCNSSNMNIEGDVYTDNINSIRLKKAMRLSKEKPLFPMCLKCDSPKSNRNFIPTNYFKVYKEIFH